MEQKTKPIILEGYAIVFNQPSVVLYEPGIGNFREYIHPEACTQAFIDSQDITLNMYHNPEKILARSRNGNGDLKVTVDNHGVKFRAEFDPNEDMFGTLAEAKALVKRGVLPGCSFEFYAFPPEDEVANRYRRGADGVQEKHIFKIAALTALTIARNPAYKSTSVNTRERKQCYGFTEREVKIIDGLTGYTNINDLKYNKTRLEGFIKVIELKQDLGKEIDIDELLELKKKLHDVEDRITELEKGL